MTEARPLVHDAVRYADRVHRYPAYAPGKPPATIATPVILKLDANEGPRPAAPSVSALHAMPLDKLAELARRYPSATPLEAMLAQRLGVDPAHLVVTAGADDALERLCQLAIEPGRDAVMTLPTFEMLPRYTIKAGGIPRQPLWLDGPFPLDAFLEALDPTAAIAFVVTPNNPTGLVAAPADLERIARRCAHIGAICVADLAYIEFADHDPTEQLMSLAAAGLPIIITRTLSKAWGLAGLRVGYALGRPDILANMRRLGHPYALSSVSLALAAHALAHGESSMLAGVEQVRAERPRIAHALRSLGMLTPTSHSNGVLGHWPTPTHSPASDPAHTMANNSARGRAVRDALAAQGIAVRLFEHAAHPALAGSLRITCPGDQHACDTLIHALATITPPAQEAAHT